MRCCSILLSLLILLVGRNSGFAQGADLTGTVFSRGLELAEIDSKASIRRIQSD